MKKAFCANPSCGKEFESKHGAKTCSVECRKRYAAIRSAALNNGRESKAIMFPCEECGTLFLKKTVAYKFCGPSCAEAKKRRNSSSRGPGWTVTTCPYATGLVRLEGGRLPDAALGF